MWRLLQLHTFAGSASLTKCYYVHFTSFVACAHHKSTIRAHVCVWGEGNVKKLPFSYALAIKPQPTALMKQEARPWIGLVDVDSATSAHTPEACGDTFSFVDVTGRKCAAHVGRDCRDSDAFLDEGYSVEEWRAVLVNCPASCGLCSRKVMTAGSVVVLSCWLLYFALTFCSLDRVRLLQILRPIWNGRLTT